MRILYASIEKFLITSEELFDLYYGDLSEEERIEKIKKELVKNVNKQ